MTDSAYALQRFMASNGYARVSTFQQPQQLDARYQQLAAQRTTGSKLFTLDQSVNTKVIDA
jgi:hypothetical protein